MQHSFGMNKILLSASLTLITVSCQQPLGSSLKGHFENSNVDAAGRSAGQQTVRAEYLPAEGVIISSLVLNDFNRQDIVRALIDTGVNSLYVMLDKLDQAAPQEEAIGGFRALAGNRPDVVKGIPQGDAGTTSIWARDWSPITAIGKEGTPLAGKPILLDFNYYPNRTGDDFTPQSMEASLHLPRVSVPVYNEGGNLMASTAGHCMMSSRVTDANSRQYRADDVIMDNDQISEQYKKLAGCSKVTIFPRMPHEGTGHIDMWAKLLNDKTVIVNRLDERTIATNTSSYSDTIIIDVRQYLDDRAKDMTDMGYTVVRIPMPLPEANVFRSYTNSLVLNGTALVPVYHDSHSDSGLEPDYEREVQAAYEAAGYKFVPLESSELINIGGAIHCITMQVGAK